MYSYFGPVNWETFWWLYQRCKQFALISEMRGLFSCLTVNRVGPGLLAKISSMEQDWSTDSRVIRFSTSG